MVISLQESRICSEMAKVFYDFLPGSGNPKWPNYISFKTVAQKIRVGEFWQSGSKEPSISRLLELTLENKRNRFEPLVLEIVKEGIRYRSKGGNPILKTEIITINGLILEIGFKFPSLWDESFLRSLNEEGVKRAADHVDREMKAQSVKSNEISDFGRILDELRIRFYSLAQLADRQTAGRDLEKLLNDLFSLFGFTPRGPFRVIGEEIDGSFELDNEVYLLEAKWEAKPLSEAPLLIFRGKVEGKSSFTRGIFVSLNGYSNEALNAIHTGKQPTFFLLDGYDLTTVLEGQVRLDDLLRAKRRYLAEKGNMFLSARDLLNTK